MNEITTLVSDKNIIQLVEDMVECYRDYSINSEIEKTKREQVRNQAKIMIAQIESNTEQYIAKINMDSKTNLAIIQQIGKIIDKPQLDENCYKLCELLLNNLR